MRSLGISAAWAATFVLVSATAAQAGHGHFHHGHHGYCGVAGSQSFAAAAPTGYSYTYGVGAYTASAYAYRPTVYAAPSTLSYSYSSPLVLTAPYSVLPVSVTPTSLTLTDPRPSAESSNSCCSSCCDRDGSGASSAEVQRLCNEYADRLFNAAQLRMNHIEGYLKDQNGQYKPYVPGTTTNKFPNNPTPPAGAESAAADTPADSRPQIHYHYHNYGPVYQMMQAPPPGNGPPATSEGPAPAAPMAPGPGAPMNPAAPAPVAPAVQPK